MDKDNLNLKMEIFFGELSVIMFVKEKVSLFKPLQEIY
jgi:hypothetical protein